MAIESVLPEFVHLVQAAPMAAVVALLVAIAARIKVHSVYIAVITFFVIFGVLLAVF